MPPVLLDGRALSDARRPELARRAAALKRRRGRPPRLLLIAFEDAEGRVAYVAAKQRRCAEAGVSVTPVLLPSGTESAAVVQRMNSALSSRPDAVFIQLPFPPDFEGEALTDAIPLDADIDVMGAAAIERHRQDPDAPNPLTVDATLALLDHHDLSLRGREGVVVGPDTPFHDQFERAFARRGVQMRPRLAPDDPGLRPGLAGAGLVVMAAGRAGLVPSGWISPGAVVIDAGYYNPGGAGDLSLTDGIDHLGALAPVPGGVGPMTVSMLVEAVVTRAEMRHD